ncbi:hypothetical protein BRY73_22860 [Ochrobactrum sp. P6BS-III]|nr:hypothetical protein BRY73_22860 [Ochrobactrum sp. P6BS-III]
MLTLSWLVGTVPACQFALSNQSDESVPVQTLCAKAGETASAAELTTTKLENEAVENSLAFRDERINEAPDWSPKPFEFSSGSQRICRKNFPS